MVDAGVWLGQASLPDFRLCRGSYPREPFFNRVTASRSGEALALALSPETVRVDLLTVSAARGGLTPSHLLEVEAGAAVATRGGDE
jgi:hypothetical protein